MKKVSSRALATLLVAALVLVGLVVYLTRLTLYGAEWASFYANDSVYAAEDGNGAGDLTDRNGVPLITTGDGGFSYSDNSAVRMATLHVTGDLAGNIGTGALSVVRSQLVNYSLITGTTGGGSDAALSIDANLNITAMNAMDGRKGAVMVYNYQTGEILCMYSGPTYDPLEGIDEDDPAYAGAYINRCISSSFAPGSVFKIVTLTAAYETRPDLWSGTFYCDGTVILGGQEIICTGTHGTQTIGQAFTNSCNCAFAGIATEVGGDALTAAAKRYGLTVEHSLDGIPVKAGSVKSGGDDTGSVAWQGIGQYEDLLCPYSLLRFMGAIAGGGTAAEPTLQLGATPEYFSLFSSSIADRIGAMMGDNVQNSYQYSLSLSGLELHAKTGTAETGTGTYNCWFTGYITNSDAPLAFVCVVEDVSYGSGLGTAAPIAVAVLQQAVYG